MSLSGEEKKMKDTIKIIRGSHTSLKYKEPRGGGSKTTESFAPYKGSGERKINIKEEEGAHRVISLGGMATTLGGEKGPRVKK